MHAFVGRDRAETLGVAHVAIGAVATGAVGLPCSLSVGSGVDLLEQAGVDVVDEAGHEGGVGDERVRVHLGDVLT